MKFLKCIVSFLVVLDLSPTAFCKDVVIGNAVHPEIEELALPKKSHKIQRRSEKCPKKYADLTPNHTMCQTDSGKLESFGVSEKDKKTILDVHNELRSEVKPLAGDMLKMYWSDELAEVAEKKARQCELVHDTFIQRQVPELPGISIGQNGAWGYGDWKTAVKAWFSEIKNYDYSATKEKIQEEWKSVGHFLQFAKSKSNRVGCGFAKCKNGKYYFCNYVYGPDYKPYKAGSTGCNLCPKSCKNKLCDCGNRVCLHNGYLNVNTCKCTCTKTYGGDSCEIKKKCDSTNVDAFFCDTPKYRDKCSYTIIQNHCPRMCKTCVA